MEVSKIIYGRVGPRGTSTIGSITEGDYGIMFLPELDLPESYQIDFAVKLTSGQALTVIGDATGARIPDELIDTGKDVYAFLYWVGEGFGKTTHIFRIENKKRANRGTPAPDPEQQSVIDQTIAALNTAVEKTAADVVSTAANADRAEAARAGAESAEETAVSAAAQAATSAESAYQSQSTATTKAAEAEASATAAAGSASEAATSADRAEQAAAQSGYMFFYIDENGDLIYERTRNVNVDFSLIDGDLYVEAIG